MSAAAKPVANAGLMMPMFFALAVLVSAIIIVQLKHRTRLLHNESNRLVSEAEQLDVEWAQLQLEEAAHSNHARIEEKARGQLKMIEPKKPINVGTTAAMAAGPTPPAQAAAGAQP